MIRIAISEAAFEAIARTLPLGNVSFENKITENGERLIWLESRVVDRLRCPARGLARATARSFCGLLRVAAEGGDGAEGFGHVGGSSVRLARSGGGSCG